MGINVIGNLAPDSPYVVGVVLVMLCLRKSCSAKFSWLFLARRPAAISFLFCLASLLNKDLSGLAVGRKKKGPSFSQNDIGCFLRRCFCYILLFSVRLPPLHELCIDINLANLYYTSYSISVLVRKSFLYHFILPCKSLLWLTCDMILYTLLPIKFSCYFSLSVRC